MKNSKNQKKITKNGSLFGNSFAFASNSFSFRLPGGAIDFEKYEIPVIERENSQYLIAK
jgi:hypothetical protein